MATEVASQLRLRVPLAALVGEYADYLRQYGYRSRGIARYCEHLRYFFDTLTPSATIDDLTPGAIREYIRTRSAWSSSTLVLALTSIRSFCRYLVEHEYIDIDPTTRVRWPRRRRAAPRALSSDQLAALVAVLRSEPRTPMALWVHRRNRRAIYLMLYAGLRLAEVAALRWEDVDLNNQILIVRDGKGGKARTMPLHPALLQQLKNSTHFHGAVIGKIDGSPLSAKSLAHVFNVWLPRLGVRISAHQLRHTFATEMLRAGAPLCDIQEALGHSDISTTRIYLLVDGERVRSAVQRLPNW